VVIRKQPQGLRLDESLRTLKSIVCRSSGRFRIESTSRAARRTGPVVAGRSNEPTPGDQGVFGSPWLSVRASKPNVTRVGTRARATLPDSKGSSARSASAWKVAALFDHPIPAEQVVSLVVKRPKRWHLAPASASFEFTLSVEHRGFEPRTPCLPAKWSTFQRLRQRPFASQGEQRFSTQSATLPRFFSG
jgi:hypothetical protein